MENNKNNVMVWISVKDKLPVRDDTYCTYIKPGKYDSITFLQFIDGEFMSSNVTHWMEIIKPTE